MRKNLGRNLTLLLLFYVEIFAATTYRWSAYSSKNEAYVNEAIYLKYICEFSDRGELYTIDFNPVTDNENYSLKLLSEDTNIVEGKRINSYEFVAFVKKPMLMEFYFDMLMKKTSQDSIENTVLGRDNVEKEEFLIRAMRQEVLRVKIKETNSSLVGDFTLEVEADKKVLKAYEPYHLKITLKGSGNLHFLKPIDYNIKGMKVFDERPIVDVKLTKEGYVGSWSQKFAFVSEKDFEIPEVRIKYYDINTHSLKELVVDSASIKVQEGFKKEGLLDSKEEVKTFDFEFIYYIFTFIAGFLVAKIKFKTKPRDTKSNKLEKKVNDCESLNELSIILALENTRKYDKLILDIESKKITSLKEAKNNLKLG